MGHVALKGKGEINEITEVLITEMTGLTSSPVVRVQRGHGTTEFALLIFEKHFMRNNSRATLTVAIHPETDGGLIIDAIGSGGGRGLILDFSLGANTDFAYQVVNILKPKGFEVLNEEGD